MKRIVTAKSIFGAISAALFVITKIVAVQIAIIWVIVDYFGLTRTSSILVVIALSIPALWATIKVSIMCWHAETDPVNNED